MAKRTGRRSRNFEVSGVTCRVKPGSITFTPPIPVGDIDDSEMRPREIDYLKVVELSGVKQVHIGTKNGTHFNPFNVTNSQRGVIGQVLDLTTELDS